MDREPDSLSDFVVKNEKKGLTGLKKKWSLMSVINITALEGRT